VSGDAGSWGEFERIARFLEIAGSAAEGGAISIGPGDDAAGLSVPAGELLLVSSDLSVEGVHFRREWLTWEAIGFRATAAALSDLAAMAARPVGVVVSLALAPEGDRSVEEGIGTGIGACLREQEAVLLGGDLCRSPGPVFIDVLALGTCAAPVRRDGARPGDELWVTGTLGGAAAAAAAWRSGLEPDAGCRRAFERPRARTGEARWLAGRAALRAMIDLSDGLAGDAGQLATSSGARMRLQIQTLPLHESLASYEDGRAACRLAASGGEDYELLIAAAPGTIEPIRPEFQSVWDTTLTRVGTVERGEGVRWVDRSGAEVEAPGGGHDHFAPDGVAGVDAASGDA